MAKKRKLIPRWKTKKFEKLVKGLKRHPKEIDNPWALAHYLRKRQAPSLYRKKK